jgi:cytoskeleton protein RodZ
MSDNKLNQELDDDIIQSPGEMLRQARLAKELSIPEISRSTRISKSMIQALENGEVENLPGRTYEIGYIKLICRITNSNSAPIIKKWVNEYYYNKKIDPYVFPEVTLQKNRPIIVTIGLLLSLIIILSYAGWYFYSINDNEFVEFKQQNDNVNINLLTQYDLENKIGRKVQNSSESEIAINKNLEKFSKILDSQDNISLTSDSKDNISLTSDSQDNISLTSDSKDNISQVLLSQDILLLEEKSINSKNNNSVKYNIGNYENISFSGINDSWVQIISSEGEMFYTGMLKKGHNLIVPNNEKLLITLGNAGAIGVEINELGIMPIGQNGEIIQAVKLDYLLEKISYINQENQ